MPSTPEEQSAEGTAGTAPPENQGYWFSFVTLLLKEGRLLALLPLGFGLATAAGVLLQSKQYTTAFSFTPVAPAAGGLSASSLAGLAGQFGVSLPMGDPAASPEFYAHLLQSDEIVQSLTESSFEVVDDGEKRVASFIELYEIDKGTRGKTAAEAMRIFRSKITSVSFNTRTSLVSVKVTTKWPDLSVHLSNRMLALVDSFNLNSRQSIANLEREFLGSRVDTARAELRSAETALQSFLERNRLYESDPALSFQFNRLQREVGLRQSVYSVILQSFEQVRLQAVQNTPSVSIVERPRPALRFDRRHTLPKVILGLIIGFALALSWVVLRDAWDRYTRTNRVEADELVKSLKSLASTGFGWRRK